MKNRQVKSKIIVTLIVLLLMLSAIIVFLPFASAQDSRKSYPFIGAIPNPVGINQEVLLHVGISEQRSSTEQGWEGLTVTVTKPDGSTETLGPFRTDSTGGTGTLFIPTQVGTYRFQTHFPEQTVLVIPFTGAPSYDLTFEAGTSDTLELVVQADPIPYYPGSSLPEEYWTRPIDSQHREWSVIGGNWVDIPANRYAPDNEYAPDTAHILWARPLATGGLMGGDVGPLQQGYATGDAYQGKFASSVIVAGKLYYNRFHVGFAVSPPQQGIFAVDLHTGEEIWFKNNTRLAYGQTLYFSSPNQHGGFAYIWDTDWNCYDAFTGEWVYSMQNVPAGVQTYGSNGEILRYVVNTQDGWMALWNSTAAVNLGAGFNEYSWAPEGGTFDASLPTAFSWNVSIPTDLPGIPTMAFAGDKIIGSDVPQGSFGDPAYDPITAWALSVSTGHEGAQLFKKSWIPPTGDVHVIWAAASAEENVFVYAGKETRSLYVFSMTDGSFKYQTETQQYMDMYTLGETRAIPRAVVVADGKIFSCGVAGTLYCYDAQSGQLEWTYNATDPYNEILWANNWWLNIMFVTDGKIYVGHDEHSPIDPKPRGAPFQCIDIETGDVVWKISGAFRQTQWGGSAIIGDSIIATYNSYDQRVYAIGKGPSSTTIEAPLTAVPIGSSMVFRGTVMDVSPGTKDSEIMVRFPKGVPVVSDESMSEWMKYVYMQFERPSAVNGVPVKIEIVDPNGEYAWIGTATTDEDGNFAYSFAPQIKGQYMVIATFDGSGAFYGSHAITYLQTDPAPSPSGPITPETPEEAPLITTELAIVLIAAIAAIVIVAFFVLRRRK